ADGRTRKVFGHLMDAHEAIPALTRIRFMTYDTDIGMNSFAQMPFDPQDGSWSNARDDTKYWFQPLQNVPQNKGFIRGLLQNAGVARPGVGVRLFDDAGTTQIASTTSGADGRYEFDDLPGGVYVAEF